MPMKPLLLSVRSVRPDGCSIAMGHGLRFGKTDGLVKRFRSPARFEWVTTTRWRSVSPGLFDRVGAEDLLRAEPLYRFRIGDGGCFLESGLVIDGAGVGRAVVPGD